MDCNDIREQISSYLDGELNKQEQEALQQHLSECSSCREEYHLLKDIKTRLQTVPMVELPENFHQEMMEKLADTKISVFPSKKNKFAFHWKRYTAIAAGFLFLFLLFQGGTVNQIQFEKSQSNSESAELISESKASGNSVMSRQMAAAPSSDAPTEVQEEFDSIARTQTESLSLPDSGQKQKTAEDPILEARKQIRTLNISMEVEYLDNAFSSLRQTVEQNGGYVESYDNSVYYPDAMSKNSVKQGSMILKVPSEFYDSLKTELLQIGTILNENEWTEDVTSQYIDTASRLRTKKAEEERLLQLMEQADTVEDLIKIEERLGNIRGEIESYESSLKNWDKLVAFSTIHIYASEKESVKIDSLSSNFGDNILNNLVLSVNTALAFCQNAILWFASIAFPAFILFLLLLCLFLYYKKKTKK